MQGGRFVAHGWGGWGGGVAALKAVVRNGQSLEGFVLCDQA